MEFIKQFYLVRNHPKLEIINMTCDSYRYHIEDTIRLIWKYPLVIARWPLHSAICTVAIAQCNLHSVPRCGRKSSTGLTAQISCCCQFWLKKYKIEIEAGDSHHTRVFEWWTFVKFLQHGNKKITTILSKYKNVFFFLLQIFQLVFTCWSNFDFLAGRRMSESFRYRRQIWFKFNSEPSFGFNTSGLTINSLGNITILIAPYSL
jgi:hypothetical protein